MNLLEALSREIERVTILREKYRQLPDNFRAGPAIASMTGKIEEAHSAVGRSMGTELIYVIMDLEGFKE